MMKRMLSILLTVCMLLSMVPAVLAADPITGTCGTGLTWSYDEAEAKLTIEGTGAMTEFSNTSAVPWAAYRSAIKTVEIAEGVTTIGKYAFNNHSALTGIIIPDSVTTIGEKAFYGCVSMLTAAIGNGVVEFGTQAFSNCTELFAVTIGSGVTEIASKTFQNCNKVTEIYYVGTQSEWEDVTVETSNGGLFGFDADKVFCMETPATGDSKDVTWTFDPQTFTLTISGEGAMKDYADTDRDWYDYRSAVRTIVVEPGVTAIGTTAFRYCSNANTVYLPATVTEIHDNAFAYCKGLEDVYYGSSEGDWAAIELGGGSTYLTGAEIHYATECAHTNITESTTSNGDGTHSVKAVCACGVVIESGVAVPCIDTSGDLKCEACGGDVSETGECTHGELYVRSYDEANGNGTHTIYAWCLRCATEFEPYTADCYDHNSDGRCDLCGGEAAEGTECDHGKDKIWNDYVCNNDGTHNNIVTCECGVTVGTYVEDCYDYAGDGICDICSGKMIEKATCDGTNHPNAEVRYEAADKEMDAADVYFHFVVLYCPECELEVGEAYTELCSDGSDDGSVCDYCEVGTPCSHEAYGSWTDIVSNGDNTHTTYECCNRCGSEVSREDADCTDEDKNNVCDVCGGDVEGVFYSLENGVLTIYGVGAMEDYASFTGMPWSAQRDTVTEIVIEEGVTHIGARSFYRCVLATKVSIASTVESIGDSAFYRCDALATVDYNGTEADWAELTASVGTNNEKLTGATIKALCAHEETTKTITSDAEAKTHTISEVCGKCGETVSVETVDCEGTPVYAETETGKHSVTVNCTVCKQLVSEAEVACNGATQNKDNGDRTHTKTVTCLDCKQVVSTEVFDCADGEDEDELCDVCGADLHCDHLTYVRGYNANGDNLTHTYAYNCQVCGMEIDPIREENCASETEGSFTCDLCGQDFSCQHEETAESYDYIINDDRTHTVITITTCTNTECDVKELSRVTADTATACTDADDDDYCDVCDGDLTCLHAVQEVKYVHNEGWSHQMQIFCTTCGDKLADTYETCVNRAGNDELCDKCGKACDHSFAVSYELNTDETHVKVETCRHTGCGKVVKTTEACDDTKHDSKCDACGNDVVCAHTGKTEHVTAEDQTHDIVSTCTICGNETACDKCKDYISTVNEACVDADHNQKCDKCGGPVACLHDGENTYVSNGDETHDVECGYCGETVETASCVNETGSDLKCDKCGYNYAVATTGTADFMTVAEAVTAVTEGGTVTLLKSVTLPAAMNISKTLTLDLGGKTLNIELDSTAIEVSAGALSVQNGAIAAVNGVFRLTGGELELMDDLIVTSEEGYVVFIKGGLLATEAELYASGEFATVTGNGLYAGDAEILGGSVTNTSDIAISWPQDGKLTISGGTVTGTTALYVKGGEVEISGDAELIATGEKVEFVHGNNGAYATGDALVVENSDYPAAPPVVTVSGGTFTSKNAAAAALYGSREDGEEVAPFITGGTFSSDVSALCAEGYVCTKSGDAYGVTAEETEVPVIEKFSIAGANMTLGNELEMNVMFPKTAIDNAGTELTAYVTHYSEDGDVVHTFTEFDAYGSSYYKLSFRVNAAQMTDTIAVEFKDADGNVYNNEYTNSVRNYVMTNIGSFNATIQTLMVDMLNYGAAAQDQFTYHQDAYANALLSEEQKALATGDVEVSDLRVQGTNYAGTTLSLQDRILLNIVFNGTFTEEEMAAMSATVSFDNALDGVKQTHENATITAYGSSRFQVTVDQIVLADASQPVTVTVYNADGTEYGSAVDSVSSYIYRMDGGTNPMYSSIMKFAASALAYGQSK